MDVGLIGYITNKYIPNKYELFELNEIPPDEIGYFQVTALGKQILECTKKT